VTDATRSVTIGRIYVHSTTIQPNNTNICKVHNVSNYKLLSPAFTSHLSGKEGERGKEGEGSHLSLATEMAQ